MKRILGRFGLPHLVAVLAVALVVGSGSAYAAQQITSRNIKNNTIKSVDVKDGALTGTDIGDGTVAGTDIGDGTVTGTDIGDGTVAGTDVADGTITGADILDSTITTADVGADTLTAADLAPNSVTNSEMADNAVGQAEIATDGVAASEIQDNSIDSGEIVDYGLTNQDVSVLFAQVNADGTLANSSGGVTSSKVVNPGGYSVDFGHNVSTCAFNATIGPFNTSTSSGTTAVADRSGNVEAVYVDTLSTAGAYADRPFQLIVVC